MTPQRCKDASRGSGLVPEKVWAVGFGAAVVAMVAWYVQFESQTMLAFEDIRLIDRGSTLHGVFAPYNDHLSVTPLVTYQVLARVFGIEQVWPFKVLATVAMVSIPVLVAAVTWRRIGPRTAVIAGSALLFFPHADMVIAAFNHFYALGAIVVAAWLLAEYPTSRHVTVAAVLLFAFASSGVSVAGAAGCVLFVAVTRAPRKRWLAVLGPCVAWLGWRFAMRAEMDVVEHPDVGTFLHATWRGVWGSFEALTFGWWPLAAVLFAAFVGLFGVRARRGLAAVAHQVAWTGALVVWWAGLAWSRWWGIVGVFRYDYVGATFVILAFLPTVAVGVRFACSQGMDDRDDSDDGGSGGVTDRDGSMGLERTGVAGSGGVTDRVSAAAQRVPRAVVDIATVGVVVLLAMVNLPGIHAQQQKTATVDPGFEHLLVYLGVDRRVAPIHPTGVVGFTVLSPDAMETVFARFGTPKRLDRVDADAWLVDAGDAWITVDGSADTPVGCVPGAEMFDLVPGRSREFVASDGGARVETRRFGERWVPVGKVPAGRGFTVETRMFVTDAPWTFRVTGACPAD